MNDISNHFTNVYRPTAALVVYKHKEDENSYVESYDIDPINGSLLNAHPLSEQESNKLAAILMVSSSDKSMFLQAKGLMPTEVLSVRSGPGGHCVWYNKPAERTLYFSNHLEVPSGKAKLPGLIWRATKDSLWVFALSGKSRPTLTSALYESPFPNTYSNGSICMGSVEVRIEDNLSLEGFIKRWESYFFDSYFSHLVGNVSVGEEQIPFWKEHVGSGKPFPFERLRKTNYSVKNMLL